MTNVFMTGTFEIYANVGIFDGKIKYRKIKAGPHIVNRLFRFLQQAD